MGVGDTLRDIAKAGILLSFKGDATGLLKAVDEIQKGHGKAFDAVVKGTKEAEEQQRKLVAQLDTVALSFNSSGAAAQTWQSKVTGAVQNVFNSWESGAKKLGDRMKSVGEIFEKANRVLKEVGLELDPAIAKFGVLAKSVGELAIEAAKLPTLIRAIIAANSGAGGVGASGWARAPRGAPGNPFEDPNWRMEKDLDLYRHLVGGGQGYASSRDSREKQISYLSPQSRAILEAYEASLATAERVRVGSGTAALARAQGQTALAMALAHAEPEIAALDVGAIRGARRSGGDPDYLGAPWIDRYSLMQAQVAEQQRRASLDPSFLGTDLTQIGGRFTEMKDLAGIQEMQRLAAERDKEAGIFTSIFGPPEEIDAFTEKLQAISDVTGVLTGVLQQSFDAWVSGSTSAVEALKKIPGAFLGGVASMSFGKALAHGAEALESLIPGMFFNPAAAAGHAKLAAMWTGIAVTTGGMARALGGGAPSVGAGATTGAAAYGGTGGSYTEANRGPTSVTIINDSSSGHRSVRWRARDTLENIQYAERYAGSGGNVVAYR